MNERIKVSNLEDQNYIQKGLDKMTETVKKKLDDIKTMFPVIVTIATSLLAFLFAATLPDKMTWFAYIIMGYLLISFCFAIIVGYPRNYYSEPKNTTNIYKIRRRRKKQLPLFEDFSPWDIESYIMLPRDEFFCKLELFFSMKLNQEQSLQANILYAKTCELRCKKFWLFFSCVFVVVAGFTLAVAFLIIGFSGSFI